MSSHISSNENLATNNNANDNALVSSEQPLPPDTRLQLELQNNTEGYNNGVQPQRCSRILPGGFTTEDKLQFTSSQQEVRNSIYSFVTTAPFVHSFLSDTHMIPPFSTIFCFSLSHDNGAAFANSNDERNLNTNR
jgi:hypothetical protein